MIGTTISHYHILEKLGEGGMGVVYKARDTRLERLVALKFLPRDVRSRPTAVDRFSREARAAAALDHPNICTVHEIDEVDGQWFIAMALVDGPTLAERLEAGPLDVGEAVGIALGLAGGLAAAHEAGIVHRDVKPANVLLTRKGEVRVADFGLAKLVDETALTQEGATVGTVAYMSPEQAQGLEVDERTDIWAVGAVLYQMITGRRPFGGDRQGAVLYAILHREPEPVKRLRKDVPAQVERVVRKALAKEPENRYASMRDLLGDLEKASSTTASAVETAVRSPGESEHGTSRPGSRGVVAVALVALALLGGVAVYRVLAPSPSPLEERLPIAVVDFHNETGEPELDGLSGMLITSLEQSRRLSVLTRSRLFDILGQLGRADVERVDEALGRLICQQAGIDLLAIASVRRFGDAYTLDVKVLDRGSSEYLVTADARGDGQESIPTLIDDLAEQIRIGINERAAEIGATQRRVASLTTANLQAYQHFFEGEELLDRLREPEAVERFRRAIELDPSFSLARYRLGYALHLLADQGGARAALDEALQSLDQMPEKERYMARAYAAHLGHSKPDLEAGLAILREMEGRYPDDKEMIFFIGDWSYHSRQYETSRIYLERALAMDPDFRRAMVHLTLLLRDTGDHDRMLEVARRNVALAEDAEALYLLGSAFARLGRFDEALAALDRALSEDASPFIHHEIAYARVASGDLPGAETAARSALDLAPGDPWSRYVLNEVLLARGKATEAVALAREAFEGSPGFHSRNLLARALVAGRVDIDEGLALALTALDERPPRYEERASSRIFFPLVEETLGAAYLSKGDPESAVPHLEDARRLAPLRPEIQEALRRARDASSRRVGATTRPREVALHAA